MAEVLGGAGGFSDVKALYDADVTKPAIERDLADLAKRYKKQCVVGRLYLMHVLALLPSSVNRDRC